MNQSGETRFYLSDAALGLAENAAQSAELNRSTPVTWLRPHTVARPRVCRCSRPIPGEGG